MIRAKIHAHEAKTHALAMPYKDSNSSQQKSRKCVFRPFLNFCKANKNCAPISKIFAKIFFYMGPHYVDFIFAFDTTLIQLEMTEIWQNKHISKL